MEIDKKVGGLNEKLCIVLTPAQIKTLINELEIRVLSISTGNYSVYYRTSYKQNIIDLIVDLKNQCGEVVK